MGERDGAGTKKHANRRTIYNSILGKGCKKTEREGFDIAGAYYTL